jgi:hypothetical protein
MKKILPLLSLLILSSAIMAQDKPADKPKKDVIDLSNRPNDHFMVQFGVANWTGLPDTIQKKGFSKSFNVYFMFDFPFKTNPHLSIALGPGISTDHILFTKTYIGIKETKTLFPFTNVSDTNHYKKNKLATAYLEAPIEFRYSADPATGKGFKWAIGLKLGTLINAHTRNTKYESKTGTAITAATMKEASKRYFNKSRFCATGRIGLGHLSLFGSYTLTPLIRDVAGPSVKPYTIGLTLSGL